ncbi:PREDICTED: cytochrome P450 4C1-like isoform X2 [Polistes dominula]|nr:PREDICTED: cytochrome P450 4C1-like isoform X2 [Polistes dominula]
MIKYLINKLHEYNLIKRFSGPKAYPLIGNLHIFLGDIKDITKKLLKAIEYSPSPWRLWLGPKLFVLLDDPKHIEIICKHSNAFEKSLVYDFMKPCIGNGLVTAPASIWKTHRKLLNPIFKEKSLSIKVDKIIKHSNRFAKILENSNEKEIDISHYINLCTLDTIYDTVLDRDFNFQNNLEGGLRDHISVLIDIATQRIFKFWLHPNIIFYNLSVGKRFREALSHLDKITSEIIKEQKESMQEKKINGEMKEKDATKYTPSFLDSLFKSFYEGKEYTEQDIRDEINTIVMAGGDSTAGTISFVFLMLATYPKIQEQVYDELYQIYGLTDPEDEHITYEDIKNMKFLDRVMKETFRLFPPSPFIARNVCEDIEVSEGVIVPKNSTCVLMLYALHRNEKYWKDPLQFNPDRFLPGNYNTKHFLPFSIVPRV